MNVLTVAWSASEGAYIVRQDDEFIGDFTDLHGALTFALAVSEHSGEDVVVSSIGEL